MEKVKPFGVLRSVIRGKSLNRKKALTIIPAAAGFILLFALHFSVISAMVLLAALGLLAAPLGGLYVLGAIGVVSDLAPVPLALAGLCCIGLALCVCFTEIRLAPATVRLFHRYTAWLKDEKSRRVWHNGKANAYPVVFLAAAVFCGAMCALTQWLAVRDGFESTVVTESFEAEKARYITISTTNLDFEIKPYDGEKIKIQYVNDSHVIIEQQDENYLRLRQDDSFTFTLLAKEQFGYKMTVWLPEYDYREVHLTSSSGAVTVDFTSAEYTGITTRSGDITVKEACEKLAVETDSGDIYCNYLAFVTAGNFTTDSGDVEIYMPDFSGVTLEFETVCGAAESDLFGEAAIEPVYHSVTLERPAKLSHYLYVTTYSGRLKLYTIS